MHTRTFVYSNNHQWKTPGARVMGLSEQTDKRTFDCHFLGRLTEHPITRYTAEWLLTRFRPSNKECIFRIQRKIASHGKHTALFKGHCSHCTLTTIWLFCMEPGRKSCGDSRWWWMLLFIWWLAAASMSVSHQCSTMSYTGCRCCSLRLHSMHLTVSDVPVQHISSMWASLRKISLAKPVSVLQNVEIWLCQEQQRNSANEVSALALRSSGTVFYNICTCPPSPKHSFGMYWKPTSSSRRTISENLVLKSILH